MGPHLLLLSLALAGEPDLDRHQALFLEARTAESEGRYAAALEACTEAVAAAPSGPRAPTCTSRLEWLEARRDPDGDFGALTELQAVRRDHRTLDPEVARERVQGIAEDDRAAELVRVDARLWLARDALDRRQDPDAALRWTTPVVETHEGPLRKTAVGLHARALAAVGRDDEALTVEAEIRVSDNQTRRTPAEQILFERRTRQAGALAGATVAGFALVAGPLAWRHRPTPFRPWGLVPLAVLVGGAALIAESWAHGAGAATGWMGLGFAFVHLLAGPALHPLTGWRHTALAALAALATVATAALALIGTDTLGWVLP